MARTESATGADVMPSTNASSSSTAIDISDAAASAAVSWPAAYRVTSSLRTQDAVDALCEKYGVPTAYIARPAGDRRACMPPPERAVCLYAHALEAGVRFPLHSFFSEVLTHLCLAPGQLTPSGWRVLVGFVVLCHDAGVQPSIDVFLYHFSLVEFRVNGWYGFEEKYHARKLFLQEDDRKLFTDRKLFFFLTSPEPWSCPVLWSKPPSKYKSYSMVRDPLLTSQQKKTMAKLLEAHGTAVDLRTYLSDTKLAAAFSSNLASSPPGLVLDSTGAKGKDSSSAAVDISEADAAAAYRVTSSLLTQDAVDALCRKHGLPTAYTALPAGDRGAFTPPPERAVCLYAHALEAGVRFPLHSFFSQALTHFRLAPGQLTPSGWRVLVGFVVLCHDAGVQPSTDVFCYFFSLYPYTSGWYGFRAKHDGCALFKGWYYSGSEETWKDRFFFLTSPEPWSCPVLWGERPSKYKCSWRVRDPAPALTSQQKKTVAKLLDAHGTAVDLQTYLSDTKLAAVFSPNVASPPPGPALHSTGAKGMDSSAAMVKPELDGDGPTLSLTKRKHEQATIAKDGICRSEQSTPHAAHGCSASASGLSAPLGFDPKAQRSPVPSLASPGVEGYSAKVKPEPDGDAPTLSLKKRKHEEAAIAKDSLCRSEQSTPHAAHGCSASASGLVAPPGFGPKARHLPVPDTHDGDSADWEAAKKVLECITMPSRERGFAAAKPSDVVASSYSAMLQAANYASFSFGYALELEKKLAARDKENAALRVQLESAKAELTAAKRAAEGEMKAKTTAM